MAEPGIANNGLFCTTSLKAVKDYGVSNTYIQNRRQLCLFPSFTDELGLSMKTH